MCLLFISAKKKTFVEFIVDACNCNKCVFNGNKSEFCLRKRFSPVFLSQKKKNPGK